MSRGWLQEQAWDFGGERETQWHPQHVWLISLLLLPQQTGVRGTFPLAAGPELSASRYTDGSYLCEEPEENEDVSSPVKEGRGTGRDREKAGPWCISIENSHVFFFQALFSISNKP